MDLHHARAALPPLHFVCTSEAIELIEVIRGHRCGSKHFDQLSCGIFLALNLTLHETWLKNLK